MKTTLTLLTVLINLVFAAMATATDVNLQWDPNTESDLAGYKVYYKAAGTFDPNGAILAANVTSGTGTTISGLDASYSYSFAVTAYNTSDMESGYSNVVVVNETMPPSVSITSPLSANVSDLVTVNAEASDNVGVSKVEFYVDNVAVHTASAAPYSFDWDTAPVAKGSHAVTAKAYDEAGNIGVASVYYSVLNDTQAPLVAITSPASSSSISGNVTVIASASDDVNVSKVEFYENNVLRAVSNFAPYNYNWDTLQTANGTTTLVAKAYDAKGNIGQSTINVTVNNVVEPPPVTEPAPYSITDVMVAMKIAVGKIKATTDQVKRLDVAPVINGKSNPNGKVDTGDAIVILSKSVGTVIL